MIRFLIMLPFVLVKLVVLRLTFRRCCDCAYYGVDPMYGYYGRCNCRAVKIKNKEKFYYNGGQVDVNGGRPACMYYRMFLWKDVAAKFCKAALRFFGYEV